MAVASTREVHGFPGYAVSDDGRVLKGDRELRTFLDRHGYRRVRLRRDGGEFQKYVHQLVALAFLGPKPSEVHCVRHIDGERTNNASTNLAWGTHRENMRDRSEHGRTPTFRGETNGRAKLTCAQVIVIRGRLERGESKRSIAGLHGVARSTIRDIATGKSW